MLVAAIPDISHTNWDVALPTVNTAKLTRCFDWAKSNKYMHSIYSIAYFFWHTCHLLISLSITIFLNSTENEIIPSSEAGKIAIYILAMCDKLDIHHDSTTPIFEDNTATMAMTNHPTYHTYHLTITYIGLLQWLKTDRVLLSAISTQHKPAGSLTKSLEPNFLVHNVTTLLGIWKTSHYSTHWYFNI